MCSSRVAGRIVQFVKGLGTPFGYILFREDTCNSPK